MGRMMASFVLFAVLRHAREIPHFEAAQARREWAYRHPRAATDITVAVLGLGELGARCSPNAAPTQPEYSPTRARRIGRNQPNPVGPMAVAAASGRAGRER